jgi:pyridoxine kinase
VSAGELADVIAGLDRRGALARCDCVLSGYLGDVAAGTVILDAVGRVRNHNGRACYCCDPVMGDDGEIYVDTGIAEFMRQRAAPAADILTPNLFELSILAESAPDALNGAPLDEIIAAARKLIGPDYRTSTVLVTSVDHAALASDSVALAAVTNAGAWLVTTPKLSFDVSPHGAGDLCAALFCAALLAGGDAAKALSRSASAVYALLAKTARLGKSELALVEAQDVLTAPAKIFHAESIF